MRQCADGMELRMKAVPGTSRSEIVGKMGDRLKIPVVAPPEHGKANRALLLLLANWLGTKNLELIAGHGNPEKTVRVNGAYELSDEQMARVK